MAENKQHLSPKNRQELNSRKEKHKQGAAEARMAMCSSQHGRATPPRAARGGGCTSRFHFSAPLRFGTCLWPAGFALIFGFGPVGPLLQPSLIYLASTSFLSPITWIDICKPEIKNLEQAKTSVTGEIGA